MRGPVGEVAQVQVKGIDCGLAWAPPYRVEITKAVQTGDNKIEIIVYNTAANALAADGHIVGSQRRGPEEVSLESQADAHIVYLCESVFY